MQRNRLGSAGGLCMEQSWIKKVAASINIKAPTPTIYSSIFIQSDTVAFKSILPRNKCEIIKIFVCRECLTVKHNGKKCARSRNPFSLYWNQECIPPLPLIMPLSKSVNRSCFSLARCEGVIRSERSGPASTLPPGDPARRFRWKINIKGKFHVSQRPSSGPRSPRNY